MTRNENQTAPDEMLELKLTTEHYKEYFKRFPDREVYLHVIIMELKLKEQQQEIKALKAEKLNPKN